MQRFVLGKLSRTELLSTLEAIRRIVMPSGGACGIACLWPLLSCALASTNSQERQDLFLLPSLLHAADYRPGLYVEIGAYDGVNMSNTYMYERCFNWTGLLVEAQPDNFAALRQRSGRNATMVHSAVCSAGTDPPVVYMTRPRDGEGNIAKQVSDVGRNQTEANRTVAVPCAPLSRLMDTAGLAQADFFSLDVEGVRARQAIAH
jgi:FkbM family methyltransferase